MKQTPLLPHLPPTTVSQALHDGIDLRLKHLSQLGAVLVDAGRLAVVQPGVVEHQPDILYVLPRLLVLPSVQLSLDGRQVHGVLHDVKVVLVWEGWHPDSSGRSRLSSGVEKGQRRERRESSEMVGGFGRPRDQDERDGEEEYDHHHHQRCSHQVKV